MGLDWDAVGALGEVVGAVGVILTLGYLAVQIRQNSKNVRSNTRQSVSTVQTDLGVRIAGDPELRRAYRRWVWNTGEPENEDEKLLSEMLIRSTLRMFENQFHHRNEGTFAEEVWNGYESTMIRSFASPYFWEWWKNNRDLYGEGFRKFFDELVTEAVDRGADV